MPGKNVVREYAPDSYYHVYNRGVNKRLIFLDDQDYSVFLSYVRRHLSASKGVDSSGRIYRHYESVELLAFCLMPNHFHMLLYTQEDPRQIAQFMQSVCVAYSVYFNKRYKRVGHLFQGRFRAVRVSSDMYLEHISRYIHLNPVEYRVWKWSSFSYYIKNEDTDWLHVSRVLSMFSGDYEKFASDYVGQKRVLDAIKLELAD